MPELDEIRYLIEEVVDLTRQKNLEVDSDSIQKPLDSHNQELTLDKLIEMHEKEQDIEQLESLDPVQSDRMTVGNLTEGLCLIEKGLQIIENAYSSEGACFFNKTRSKKKLACYKEILREGKKSLTRQTT
ncbi:tigger transposable element-derived protein 1 [Trichonephila clavipes]|nr:tigger transposable element-derived protein 1 [Trichonephila clavipes]